jgi:hypothetical protein
MAPSPSGSTSSALAATMAVSSRNSRRDSIEFETALADVRRSNEGKAKMPKTSATVRKVNNVFGLEGSGMLCPLVSDISTLMYATLADALDAQPSNNPLWVQHRSKTPEHTPGMFDFIRTIDMHMEHRILTLLIDDEEWEISIFFLSYSLDIDDKSDPPTLFDIY